MRHFKAPRSQPLEFHAQHQVEIRPAARMRGQGYYHCLDCNKWIAWLSREDSATARQLGLLGDQLPMLTLETAPRKVFK